MGESDSEIGYDMEIEEYEPEAMEPLDYLYHEPSRITKTLVTELCVDSECSICLSDLSRGRVVRLSCNSTHIFHDECISQWFSVSRKTCPLCRK
jgi:hypothetical protein